MIKIKDVLEYQDILPLKQRYQKWQKTAGQGVYPWQKMVAATVKSVNDNRGDLDDAIFIIEDLVKFHLD